MRQRRRRTERGAGTIAEFGPVLFIFFVVLLLPLISLFSFVAGCATLLLAANVSAREAGTATTFTIAKQNVSRVGDQIIGGGLGKFGGITPADASKLELFAFKVALDGGDPQPYAPGEKIETDKFIYEYQVRANYNVQPIFSPKAFPMQFVSNAHVEHPNGLSQ